MKRPATLETFESIELTPEETAEALRRGREEKYYELKKIEYNERMKAQRVFKAYSAGELEKLYCLQYEIDKDNQEVMLQIFRYFSGDPAFNGDLGKGLFVMGGVGVGKTSLMKFFVKNQRFSFRVDSCRDIETNYAAYGDEYLEKVSGNLQISVNSDPFGHKEIGICFDDLGTEANGKHYGKEKNVMAEVLLNRYDAGLPYCSTHVTTNLTADAVREQYGTRVTDRIKAMFNIIKFPTTAKSRRI